MTTVSPCGDFEMFSDHAEFTFARLEHKLGRQQSLRTVEATDSTRRR
jgi:hypothetical protein